MLAAVAVFGPTTPAQANATTSPSDIQAQQWWITRLGLDEVWKTSQGAGVTVALLDSGVDASRGDLAGAIVPDPGIKGYASTDPDDEKHGTQMASYIAGRGTAPGVKGVAPQAKILPINLTGSDGAISLTTALTELASLPTPPRIVNMSVASSGACDEPGLQDAVLKAVAKGMILVAAAGNNGESGNEPQYPADCTGVIAVSAVDNSLNVWAGSNGNPSLSLAAPGADMISSIDGTTTAQTTGTSNAAAILSGEFAVLVSHFPDLSSRDIVTRMLYTARQFEGDQGTRNDDFGYGLARVHHALTDDVPSSAPNPIYDAVAKLSPTKAPSSTPEPSTAAQQGDPAASVVITIAIIVGLIVVALIVVLIIRSRRRRRT